MSDGRGDDSWKDDLADAVADGRPVDFEQLRREHPEDIDYIDDFEALSRLANLRRGGADEDAHWKPPFMWRHLEVRELIGGGGYGQVYRAFDTVLKRQVALKLVRPRARHDIIHEGTVLASVEHENIMRVYGGGHDRGRDGIWGEFIDGKTLWEMVERDGPFNPAEATEIGITICHALTTVHQRGLVHGDIKALNVMRERRGRIVLVDFSLGHEVARLQDGARDVGLAGTPLYLAPELFREEPAGTLTEIYAVGVLLYYLVTRNYPVFGRTIDELIELHEAGVRSHLQDEGGIPDVFAEVVERALAPNPDKRFQSAGEFRMALRRALNQQSLFVQPDSFHAVPLPVVPPPPPPGPWAWSLWRGLTLIAAITVVALVGLVVFSPARTPPPSPVVLTLSPPPDGFVEGSRNVPAVSPDGKKIAFVGKQGKEALLFVRDLSQTDPRAILNTTGASRPFWSPGGESLAYFGTKDGRRGLLRIDVTGAQQELLTEGTESRGGSWGKDGDLLFALDPHSGLQTMKASRNAKITFATRVDKERKEAQHMWPQFLPDGRRFLFFVLSGEESVEGIYLGSLDGGAHRLVVKTHTSALLAGSSLIFTNNGQLFTQSFDLAAGTLTGEEQPLDLALDATYDALLVLSSANGTLVYRRPELRQLAWYTMNGTEIEPLGQPGGYRNAVVSPDGRFVVAEIYFLDRRELVSFALAHDNVETVLPLPRSPSCPTWASDNRLAFAALTESFADIFVTHIDRPRQWTPLVQSEQEKEPNSWSPDRSSLIYVALEPKVPSRNQDLWISRFDPRPGVPPVHAPFAASAFVEVSGQYSPRGRWIAYVSSEENGATVYVRRPGDTEQYKVSSGSAYDPQWLSDDTLLYLDADGWLWQATIPADNPTGFKAAKLFRTGIRNPGTSRNHYSIAHPADPKKRRLLLNSWSGTTTFSVVQHWRAPGPTQ